MDVKWNKYITTLKLDGDTHLRFLDHCKNGGSINQFCLAENIRRSTFDNWCRDYEHMQQAKIDGKVFAEAWWVDQAQTHLIEEKDGPKLNTKLYTFVMGGRFGHTSDKDAHDRLDKIEAKLTDKLSSLAVSSESQEPEYEVVIDSKAE